MSKPRSLLALALITGCGFNVTASGTGPQGDDAPPDASPDAPPDGASDVPPRVIPGGGIDDGPVNGVVNVYAIDALTRKPIAGAGVDVGAITGTTDAAGLFVARASALQGAQTVLVTITGYRSELWVGVAGANVTVPLKPQPVPAVPSADVSGTITGFSSGPPLPSNHVKQGVVGYSQLDGELDAVNNLRTTNGANTCRSSTCAYTVTTRTGNVALLAAVFDVDTKGNSNDFDDTRSLLTYAYKTGLTVVDGVDQANQALTQMTPAQLADISVDFGTPPFGVGFAVVGVEVPGQGTSYLSEYPTIGGTTTLKAPVLTVIPGAQYRFVGYAAEQGALSIVIRRGLAASPLLAGSWLGAPSLGAVSRTAAAWTTPAGATVTGALYKDATLEVLEVLAFDVTSSVTFPARLALPPTALSVRATALRATFDVAGFSFLDDVAAINASASSASTAIAAVQ